VIVGAAYMSLSLVLNWRELIAARYIGRPKSQCP